MDALITQIQRFSVHDGPGIRTAVFFKGCPLSCIWCHNPESKRTDVELSVSLDDCIGCGTCEKVCPEGAASPKKEGIVDRSRCKLCFTCTENCPPKALQRVGTEYSIEEIVNMDFKEFDMSGKRVGIGQVFTLDIDSIFAKKDEFLSHINSTDYDMLVLAVTDILKEGSYLIYKAEDKIIAEAFSVEATQGVFAPGVVSRKKQLVPNLTAVVKNI
jgi:ferredoxin